MPPIESIENPIVRETIPDPHWGVDYFGDEIVEGDEIFEYDGELFLVENAERFLCECLEIKKRCVE